MAPKTLARVAPPVTALALAESQARNERHQASAVAPNTRKAYASDWKAFEAWCRARGAPALPADPKHVALYLSDMQGAGSKLSSIERALSTISVRHRDALVFFSRTDDAIARTIRGIRRDLGQAAINAKAPLETKILQKLCAGLPETPSARAIGRFSPSALRAPFAVRSSSRSMLMISSSPKRGSP